MEAGIVDGIHAVAAIPDFQVSAVGRVFRVDELVSAVARKHRSRSILTCNSLDQQMPPRAAQQFARAKLAQESGHNLALGAARIRIAEHSIEVFDYPDEADRKWCMSSIQN